MNRVVLISALFALTAPALGAWETGMQEPANEIAEAQRWLNAFMLWIITIIGAGVFGVMFYAIIRHRKDAGHKAAHFHENTTVEIIWTAVPMLIIIGNGVACYQSHFRLQRHFRPRYDRKSNGVSVEMVVRLFG